MRAYRIVITQQEHDKWHQQLVNGQELPREIAGLLLGRAKPVELGDRKGTKHD